MKSLRNDKKGIGALVSKVVGVAIALFVVAIIMPLALNQLANSSTTVAMPKVNSAVITMLAVLLPVLAVVGIALYFIPRHG
jgi:hypothetical protein